MAVLRTESENVQRTIGDAASPPTIGRHSFGDKKDMERRNVLGMICGYYLSRFDQDAYARFGGDSQSATHKAIAGPLSVPAESIKNRRDEFDPVHDNPRQGWHTREMYTSRKRVIEAFAELSEPELFAIVSSILTQPAGESAGVIVAQLAADSDEANDGTETFSLRGPTGAKAEAAFIDYHCQTRLPAIGELRDCRYDQCGYDFAIDTKDALIAVEVKGLSGQTGGLSLTGKEWQVAKDMGDLYFLAVVRNVGSQPDVSLIQNPASLLTPAMRVYTTLQVSWTVSQASLSQAESRGAESR